MEKSTVGTYDFIRCKWWIGFWVFFFRKMKKSHFLPIVPSVGMTWVRYPGPELAGSRSCSCTIRFWLTALCISLACCFLSRSPTSVPGQKGRVGKPFPFVCSGDFPPAGRWEGAAVGTCWLLPPQIIQTTKEGSTLLFTNRPFPLRKQRPYVLKEATSRCVHSWNLPSGCSHWETLPPAAAHPSWGDVRRNGWEHAFTSCSRNPSV